jgi:glycerol-3-phosphate acyltransferase PlsY
MTGGLCTTARGTSTRGNNPIDAASKKGHTFFYEGRFRLIQDFSMTSVSGLLLFFVIGYALGSIPFGLILTRMAGLGDIRQIGSGNIGATNVLRTGHKGLAFATLMGDALKGTAAVCIARYFGPEFSPYVAAAGAFFGHVYSIWLKFKGGKGVATYVGVLLGLNPWIWLFFGLIWLSMAAIFRYSSLAALTALAVTPFIAIFPFHNVWMGLTLLLLSAVSWWRHRENIRRLLKGEETKIMQKKPEPESAP